MVNYAFVAACTGNIIAFITGNAITWSSPVLPKLNTLNEQNPFERTLTAHEKSWIGSLVALGASFGPFIYGYAADKFGRKLTLTSLAIPFLVSNLLLAFCPYITAYYIARVIIGLAIGGVFTVLPMYVGEVAQDSNRGALGSIMNCFITSGFLFTYVVGPKISIMCLNTLLAVFPVCFIGIFLFLAPETPQYYISKQDDDKAITSLHKLRGKSNPNNLKEFEQIKENIQKNSKGTILDIFRSKGLTKALIICMALVSFQQLSGINAILFYAENIFAASGSKISPSDCSVIIGAVQVGASIVTPLIADKLGRRLLLIISAVGMFVSEVSLGVFFYLKDNGNNVEAIFWLPVAALVVYIVTYNFGFGPLPWAVMGEMFPSNVKSIASSLTASFCWLLGFLITKFFQTVVDSIGMGQSFWLFSGFCVAALLFCWFYLIETRGKNVQEILDILNE